MLSVATRRYIQVRQIRPAEAHAHEMREWQRHGAVQYAVRAVAQNSRAPPAGDPDPAFAVDRQAIAIVDAGAHVGAARHAILSERIGTKAPRRLRVVAHP